jgi:hypothetical protein
MLLSKDLAEFDEVGEAIVGFLMPVIEAVRANGSDLQEWPAKGPWRKSDKPSKK